MNRRPDWPHRQGIGLPCAASYACPVISFPSIAEQHRHNKKFMPPNQHWFGEFSEVIDNAWKKPPLQRTVFRKLANTLKKGDTLYIRHPRIILNAAKDIKPIQKLHFNIVFCWRDCYILNGQLSNALATWIDGRCGPNQPYKKSKRPPYAAVNTPKGMKWDEELRKIMGQIVELRDQQKLSFREIARTVNHPRIKCHKLAKRAYLFEKAYRFLNVRFPQEFDPKFMPQEHVLQKIKTPFRPSLSTLSIPHNVTKTK